MYSLMKPCVKVGSLYGKLWELIVLKKYNNVFSSMSIYVNLRCFMLILRRPTPIYVCIFDLCQFMSVPVKRIPKNII